jgi:hypothetical protein
MTADGLVLVTLGREHARALRSAGEEHAARLWRMAEDDEHWRADRVKLTGQAQLTEEAAGIVAAALEKGGG